LLKLECKLLLLCEHICVKIARPAYISNNEKFVISGNFLSIAITNALSLIDSDGWFQTRVRLTLLASVRGLYEHTVDFASTDHAKWHYCAAISMSQDKRNLGKVDFCQSQLISIY